MGVLNIYVIKSREDLGNQLLPFWVCVFGILFKNSLFNSRSLKCFAVFFFSLPKTLFLFEPQVGVEIWLSLASFPECWDTMYIDVCEQT